MKIETVPVESLTLDPANVRTHPDKNLEAIRGSLKRWGQQKPIVVGKDNVVVAGNGTLQCAREIGWKHIKIVRTKLEGSERAGFAIADNRTAELATWSDSELAATLKALKDDVNIDHLAAGFTDQEIDDLLGMVPNFEPTDVDEQPRLDEKSPTKCPECGYEFTT